MPSCSDLPSALRSATSPHHEDTPTAKNIKEFSTDYELAETLGEGANGWVKRCIHRKTGKEYAVKMSEIEEEHILTLKKSFKAIQSLNHPDIIKYHAMYIAMHQRMCYLVMDYISQPSLSDFIYPQTKDQPPLSECEIQFIMKQLLEAIRYLHCHKICHRDIKPDNLLYDRKNSKIWLIDFGVSKVWMEKHIRKEMLTNTGTPDYKAPELYEGGSYTHAIDLWAAGVVLFEMIEKRLPFRREYLSDTIKSILEIDCQPSEIWFRVSRYAKDLLSRLFKPKNKRLTAEEALKAPWFLERDSARLAGPVISSTTLSIPFKFVNGETEEEEDIQSYMLSPIIRQNTVTHTVKLEEEPFQLKLVSNHSVHHPNP